MNTALKMNTIFEERGGSWDEKGLVESLDRKGFTSNKCCSELIANSHDAQATKIIWKIDSKHIKLIDDGIGMKREKLQDMFKMFKSNNSERKTMGVSGLGGKEGTYILSKKINKEPTSVIIYTQFKDGEHLKTIIPWKEIFDEKRYTGKIIFTSMLEEEIISFNNDLKDCKFNHGTIILLEYNDELKDIIEKQFSIESICKSGQQLHPTCRWDMIFGHVNSEVILEKTDGTPSLSLVKYDYFSGNDSEFYTGKSVDTIHHYIDDKNEDRYIFTTDDCTKEITPYGKNGFKTEPSNVKIHQTWVSVGHYDIFNGLRVDPLIFDPENPKEFSTATTFLNSYDSQYFTSSTDAEHMKESLSGCSVYRNSQMITKIQFEDKTFNAKTCRGNGEAMLNKFHHRTEIRYTTESKQDNRMDIAMGIQENKNQHQNILPKQLERLVIYSKKENLKKIHNYFNSVIKTKLEQDKEKRRLVAEQKKIAEEQKLLLLQQKRIAEEQKQLESKKPFIIISDDSDASIDSKPNFHTGTIIKEEEDDEEEDDEEEQDEEEEQDDDQNVTGKIVTNLVTHEENSIINSSEPIQLNAINIQTIVETLYAKKYSNEKLIKIYDFINSL
jgi:hypothetical protein